MASTGRGGIDAAFASFRRRKWVALSIFALVLSAALSFAKSLPNLYQSTATVLVERPATPGGGDDVESRLQSIRQEILSRARLVELIGRFDLYPAMRLVTSQEAVVERMRRDVRIDASGSELATGRGTIAFALAYRGRDPVKVTLVANALTSSYIQEDSVVRDRQTSGAASVLRAQLDEVKKRLAPQEARIAEFKRLHAGELPQQTDSSFLAVERLNGQLQKVSETRAAAVERRATLLRESGEPGAGTDAADPDRIRLARLNQELAALRTRFSDRYPDVASKKSEIESLAAVVAQKPVVDRALPQLEQANREIRGFQADEARLRGEMSSYQRRVEGAPFREQEYQALSRDYATTREFYDTLLKRYEEAQLAEAREDGPQGQRLRLLDPAITPVDALAPDRFRLAMFGLIAAMALAVIGVAAAEKLDTSFHSADDLGRHTRVPVLVRIPKMSTDSAVDRTRARRRGLLMALGLMAAMVLTVSGSRIMARDNEGVVALLAPRGRS
jgi:polysaccharide chain length determinant protein (PEP-CTERM system associated)